MVSLVKLSENGALEQVTSPKSEPDNFISRAFPGLWEATEDSDEEGLAWFRPATFGTAYPVETLLVEKDKEIKRLKRQNERLRFRLRKKEAENGK